MERENHDPLREADLALLLKAVSFAAHKHRDQRRKDEGESPYINHPIAVAEVLWNTGHVRDIATIVAGILHDTIEDTETTAAELESEFGREICSVVEEVSDDKSLAKEERKRLQIEHAGASSTRAREVKLADKICNVTDLAISPPANWSAERRQEYIEWSTQVVARLRGTNERLERKFDEACRRAQGDSTAK